MSATKKILAAAPGRHSQLIRPFAHGFVLRRARKASERHPYTHGAAAAARNRITSAIAFLSWLEARNLDLATLSQGDLDRWLVSGEPHRREIRSFLAWAASRRLAPALTVPQRSSRQMPAGMQSEEDLGQQLQRCLTDTVLPADVRAAGAIVTLFGLPLSKIVQLTAEQLTDRDRDVLAAAEDGSTVADIADDAAQRAGDRWRMASMAALPLRHAGQKLFGVEGSGFTTKAAVAVLYVREP